MSLSQEEIVVTVDKFVKYLSKIYKFGFYEPEDLKQEAYLRALQAMKDNHKYDTAREAKSYLFMVVKNHFKNLLRKYRFKNEPPCLTCPLFDPELRKTKNQCLQYINKLDCDKWRVFNKNYQSKKDLLNPADLSLVLFQEDEEKSLIVEDSIFEDLTSNEMFLYISTHLDNSFRSDFLKILAGVKVSDLTKIKIQREVATILKMGNFEITYVDLDNYTGESHGT